MRYLSLYLEECYLYKLLKLMQPGKIDSEKKQNKENVVWREEEILDREKENL